MALRYAETAAGTLRGTAGNNPCYSVFKGIPYAKPPIGDLRWRPPVQIDPWEGVRDASTFSCIAPQIRHRKGSLYQNEFFRYAEAMSEDCLYLNVWTPAESDDERLPVIFWIHGGALAGGYGSEPEFDGEGFCRRGVILVTFNYRVGALGFMAHPELSKENGGSSGNWGHLDQVAALHWVKENIAAFGGDPNRITVAGQSSGAISAQMLMLSPLTQHDICGAILQSAGGVWPRRDNYCDSLKTAEQLGERFMEKLGSSSIAELRKLSWEQLVALQPINPYEAKFISCVDGLFLLDEPLRLLQSGQFPDMPCLLGSNAVEMGYSPDAKEEAFAQLQQLLYGREAKDYLAFVTSDELRGQVGSMASIMQVANRTFACLQEKLGHRAPYLYYFDRAVPGEDKRGAFHSSELWYVFQTLSRCWRPMNGKDWELSNQMADYWSRFAQTGDPNMEALPTWEAYTAENPEFLRLGEATEMIIISERPDQVFTREFLLKGVQQKDTAG